MKKAESCLRISPPVLGKVHTDNFLLSKENSGAKTYIMPTPRRIGNLKPVALNQVAYAILTMLAVFQVICKLVLKWELGKIIRKKQ